MTFAERFNKAREPAFRRRVLVAAGQVAFEEANDSTASVQRRDRRAYGRRVMNDLSRFANQFADLVAYNAGAAQDLDDDTVVKNLISNGWVALSGAHDSA